VAWVRERTIPTERQRLSAKLASTFAHRRCFVLIVDGSIRPYSRLPRPEPLFFLPSSFSVVLTRLSGPRSRPTTSQKIWYRRESNPDYWICSQEPWNIWNFRKFNLKFLKMLNGSELSAWITRLNLNLWTSDSGKWVLRGLVQSEIF
jgi:hypothetical protein